MTSELSIPVLKNPEPLEVTPLLEKWIEAGLAWKGVQMFWRGSEGNFQNYLLKPVSGAVLNVQVLPLLSEDEKIIFRAFQDWFQQAIKKSAESLCGYYTFDILQFEINDAPRSWNEFTALLIAHAKKIAVNERRLIQFAGLWGVLHKRTEAEFGRVESKLNLDFCKTSRPALARLIKKQSAKLAPDAMVVFRDLSQAAFMDIPDETELLSPPLFFQTGLSENLNRLIYLHPGTKRCLGIATAKLP